MSIPESSNQPIDLAAAGPIAPPPQKEEVICHICHEDVNILPKLKLDACCQKEVHRNCLAEWVKNCAKNGWPQKCPNCNVEGLPSDREIRVIAAETGEGLIHFGAVVPHIERVVIGIADFLTLTVNAIDERVASTTVRGVGLLLAALDSHGAREGHAQVLLLAIGITLATQTTRFLERQVPALNLQRENAHKKTRVAFLLLGLTGLISPAFLIAIQEPLINRLVQGIHPDPLEIDDRGILKKIKAVASGIGGAMIGAAVGIAITMKFVNRRSNQDGMTEEVVNVAVATVLATYLMALTALGGAQALGEIVEKKISKELGKTTLLALTALSLGSEGILIEGNENINLVNTAAVIGTVVGLLLNGGRNILIARLIGIFSFLHFSFLTTRYFQTYEHAYQSRTFEEYTNYLLS